MPLPHFNGTTKMDFQESAVISQGQRHISLSVMGYAKVPRLVVICRIARYLERKITAIFQGQGHLRFYFRTWCSLPLAMSMPCFVGITKTDLEKVQQCNFLFKMVAISRGQGH